MKLWQRLTTAFERKGALIDFRELNPGNGNRGFPKRGSEADLSLRLSQLRTDPVNCLHQVLIHVGRVPAWHK